MLYFAEKKAYDGSWRSVLFHDGKPETITVNGKVMLKSLNGNACEVRAITEVPATKANATLAHLQAVFSPDGHLRGTQQSVSIGG